MLQYPRSREALEKRLGAGNETADPVAGIRRVVLPGLPRMRQSPRFGTSWLPFVVSKIGGGTNSQLASSRHGASMSS